MLSFVLFSPDQKRKKWGDFLLSKAKMETHHHDNLGETKPFSPLHFIQFVCLYCLTYRQGALMFVLPGDKKGRSFPELNLYLLSLLFASFTSWRDWSWREVPYASANYLFINWAVDIFVARNLQFIGLGSPCPQPRTECYMNNTTSL